MVYHRSFCFLVPDLFLGNCFGEIGENTGIEKPLMKKFCNPTNTLGYGYPINTLGFLAECEGRESFIYIKYLLCEGRESFALPVGGEINPRIKKSIYFYMYRPIQRIKQIHFIISYE